MAGLLPQIPVLDLRDGGPVEHARRRRHEMLALRDACFSVVPAPLRGLARPLDRVSSAWLKGTPSPYVGEIAEIAAIAERPGVWFVNASYEWGCTTRIDVEPAPILRRTLDWPFPGLGRYVEVALQDGGAGPYASLTWPGAVGVLTAVARGRFAAAINQAPLYRRTKPAALLPTDFLLNGIATWRQAGRWPAAHLLRFAFDHLRRLRGCGRAPGADAARAAGAVLDRRRRARRGRPDRAHRDRGACPPRPLLHRQRLASGRACPAGALAPARAFHPRRARFGRPPRAPRPRRQHGAVRLARPAGAQRVDPACGRGLPGNRRAARHRVRADVEADGRGAAGDRTLRGPNHLRRAPGIGAASRVNLVKRRGEPVRLCAAATEPGAWPHVPGTWNLRQKRP